MKEKKSIVILGCSNSAGAELSHDLITNHWDNVLDMKDPYNGWWSSPHGFARRHKDFFEKAHDLSTLEDWEYNVQHNYAGFLHRRLSTKYDIINAASSGTGISFVKLLYDLPHHRFSGSHPILSKLTKDIIKESRGDGAGLSDMMGKETHPYSKYETVSNYENFKYWVNYCCCSWRYWMCKSYHSCG